jgi:hypothetical protein
MSIKDQISQNLNKYIRPIKVRLLGANNERLDFLMDSFYKLSPPQRNGVFAGGIALLALLILAAFALYFSEVRALESELSMSVASLQELRTYKQSDQSESRRFAKLVETINAKTRGLSFKPFFEKMTKEKNIPMKDLTEKEAELESSNPLSDSIKEVLVELRVPQISIPRLLNFITDVEKAERYIRLKNIRITGQYGNKLYFDTTLVFRGYSTKR